MKFALKKQFLFLVLAFAALTTGFTQKKTLVPVEDIFADLPFDDPASNSILRDNENAAEKIKQNIFIRSFLSKKRCFIGEPVLFTVQLYTRLQSTSTIVKQPYITGFLSSSIDIPGENEKYKKEGGRNYRFFTVLQRQLIPTETGTLKIDNLKIENKVKYRDAGGRDKFYSGMLSSDSIILQVDTLPGKTKPADFAGLTGNFTLAVFPGFNNVAAGQNNILHVEITGTGNYLQAVLPLINWPDSVERFAINEKVEIIRDSFPLTGIKRFELTFVPAKEGNITIPPVHASYFDPVAKEFKAMVSEPVILNVTAAEKQTPRALPDPSIKGKAIKLIYVYGGGAVLILLLLLFSWLYRRNKEQKMAAALVLQLEEDKRNLKHQIELAYQEELRKVNEEADSLKFITSFKSLLTGYLQAKMGTALNLEEELIKKLQAKDIKLAAEVQELFEDCNTFLYAPASLAEGDRFLLNAQLTEVRKKAEVLWE